MIKFKGEWLLLLSEQNGKEDVYSLETATKGGGADCVCVCVGTVNGAFRKVTTIILQLW